MGILKSAVLYTALGLVANSAFAQSEDLSALLTGDMARLTVHNAPISTTETEFTSENGEALTLAAFEGKVVLLNFWATWCAPCRAEMPSLAALQKDYGGDDFEVLTIATGRNPAPAINRFFDEIDVDTLPKHTDARQKMSRSLGVIGLPVTILIDRDGFEVARLQGEADWDSEDAHAIIEALLAQDTNPATQ